MRKKYGFVLRFGIVAALLGFFSPSVREVRLSDGGWGVAIKVLNQAEARRGGRGGGARRGGGRSFRGGGMRSRPAAGRSGFSRSRSVRSVSRSRNYGGNFHRAPSRTRSAVRRPAGKRPVSKRPVAKRPSATRPVKKPGGTRPVQRPVSPGLQKLSKSGKKPVTTQPGGPVTIQPVKNPAAGRPQRPARPDQGERPNRPGERPVTIQPTENPLTGRPMPGHPDYRPPGQRPPAERPPHDRPPQRPPYYDRPGWDDHYDYWDDDWWYRPAGAVTAGIVVGSIVAALPPGCESEVVEGTTYYHCNGTWYLPYYEGSVLKYKVVRPPR